jgi:ElaB/YqjD/DUF883 family membrane-anchored ribosome-binding protein
MSAGYPGSSTGQGEEHKGITEAAQEKVAQVGEMAGHLKEKAQEMAGQARDKAREFVSGVTGQAQETWRSAREGVQEGWSTVSGRAGDIWEDATTFVRRYPIASLAVAFGLGCLTATAFAALSRMSTDDVADRMSRSSM